MFSRRLDRLDWAVISMGLVLIGAIAVAGFRESKNTPEIAAGVCAEHIRNRLENPAGGTVDSAWSRAWGTRRGRGEPYRWQARVVVDERSPNGVGGREYYHCEMSYEPWPRDRWTLHEVTLLPP